MDSPVASAPTQGTESFEPRLERLDARALPYWIASSLLFAAFVVAAGYVAWRYFGEQIPPEHRELVRRGALVAGASLVVLSILQPALSYACWRYAVDDRLLVARYGILFRAEKTIPISRMQHVDLTRGPIERLFGLATLVVYTAGTEEASFRVPGLSVQRARELRDHVLAARGDDVV